jgi:hypothetical protein
MTRFSTSCMEFMTSLKPILEFEDCLVTHVEPYHDPFDIFELWSFESEEEVGRSFEELPHRLMFHGHHHKWTARTPAGKINWSGSSTLTLNPDERFLIQVAAVCDGRCAILDTSAHVFHPIQLLAGDSTRAIL